MYETLTQLTLLAVVHTVLLIVVIPIILIKKRDTTVAVAWCLFVLLTPLVGSLVFWVFGFNYIQRRVIRKRTHRSAFRQEHPPSRPEATRGAGLGKSDAHPLAGITRALDTFPISHGNRVQLLHHTTEAYQEILNAIDSAQHHVHLQFFIVRNDETTRGVLQRLANKAREGLEVRLLYDAVGSLFLRSRQLRELINAGGQAYPFLPINPFRSWIQVNLRNHRKAVIVDGKVAITGGMNLGDEYLGKSPCFGYWRDTMVRLEGPTVAALQRIFIEDWDFATHEALQEERYFPLIAEVGEHAVQVAESGPDQEPNTLREIYFAAILSARKRLWIASPYFVPDSGLLDALRLARFRGVDVRLLCLLRPDHLLSFYASRFYWADLLAFGGKVYQYARGMMHSKIIIVDDDWATVGSANMDNRSLHLNFESNCCFYSPALVAELARQYQADLHDSIPLDTWTFANRSLAVRLLEHGCRLFAPIL
ncbi:MAG: cardiolipin synthase [Gemmataceae bacterium]